MSGDINPLDVILPGMAGGSRATTRGAQKGAEELGLVPQIPQIPDIKPPTVTQARQRSLDEFDRLRRRRGVLANIFGGQAGTGAGVKQLLG